VKAHSVLLVLVLLAPIGPPLPPFSPPLSRHHTTAAEQQVTEPSDCNCDVPIWAAVAGCAVAGCFVIVLCAMALWVVTDTIVTIKGQKNTKRGLP